MTSLCRLSRADFRRPTTSVPVQVSARLRPGMGTGQGQDASCVCGVDSHSLEILNWKNDMEVMKYKFDAFYGEAATQYDVYMGSVQPILHHLLEGQNASILAYGPTGAGKTHTMLGNRDQPGVIPRAVGDVLKMTREATGREYSVSMSYLEIYQEKVLDLLQPSLRDLPIREDYNHNILVPDLTQKKIADFSDFESYFLPATSNRTVASTQLNQRSSRSHAVLLVWVSQTQGLTTCGRRTAKLCLIDLAGSEDNRRTGNRGVRLKESGAINNSLFVLSKVVDALSQGLPRVPYRDSKLTRLLQDSLGGNAHSVIIANIAPERKYYFETLTSLNFAAKSKQIMNKPFTQKTLPEIGEERPTKPEEDETLSNQSRAGGRRCLSGGKRPYIASSNEGPETKRPCPHEEQPRSPVEKPLSSLLPLENFEPALAERLLRLEAIEKEQGRAGHHALPLLNTPRRERLQVLKLLNETRRELQSLREKQLEMEAQALKKKDGALSPQVTKPRKQATVLPLQQVQTSVKSQEKEEGAVTLKATARGPRKKMSPLGTENTPAEWDRKIHLDRRTNILSLLNSGSVKDLMALHQIGKKKAQLIVSWRGLNGSFEKIEDLKKIEGITAKQIDSFIKSLREKQLEMEAQALKKKDGALSPQVAKPRKQATVLPLQQVQTSVKSQEKEGAVTLKATARGPRKESLQEKQLEMEAQALKKKDGALSPQVAKPPQQATVLSLQQVQASVKSQEEEKGIVILKAKARGPRKKTSALGTENKPPPEWKLEFHPDLLAHSKANILSLLNSGSMTDLMALHGIGKKKAQLIMSWRDLYGSFEKVEDLEKIDGITAKQIDSFIKANIFRFLGNLQ